MELEGMQWIASVIFGAGSGIGAAKVIMNGTKNRVDKLEEAHTDVVDRLARIETKLDMLLKD